MTPIRFKNWMLCLASFALVLTSASAQSLFTETFDDPALTGWAALDEPVYTVTDGKLDWTAVKFDAFVSGFTSTSLAPGEYLELTIVADFDVLSGSNNTFRFGLMAFGDGNIPTTDQTVNQAVYNGGVFGTLAHKDGGTSRVMTHLASPADPGATVLESFKVGDDTVNIGDTVNGTGGVSDNASHTVVFRVTKLGVGYSVNYWLDGVTIHSSQVVETVDNLSFDGVALYANHTWEGNIDFVSVDKGLTEGVLLTEPFDGDALSGWAALDEPVYVVADGKLDWTAAKFDAFVKEFDATELKPGEFIKLSITADFDVLSGSNNTFRFGLMSFGNGNVPSADQSVNTAVYNGGVFATLAHKDPGTSRIMTHIASPSDPGATVLESFKVGDDTVNIGDTLNGSFGVSDSNSHEIELTVVKLISGYEIHYSVDGEAVFSNPQVVTSVDNLAFDGVALYANHPWEGNINSVLVETGSVDSVLLSDTFDGTALDGWYAVDEPTYAVADGKLNWDSTKLDAFVAPIAPQDLEVGQGIKLSVVYEMDVVVAQNNTFRFGFMGFGDNDLTGDLPVNSAAYDGGIFGTLATKEGGKSRIQNLLSATAGPILETLPAGDGTNRGETYTTDFEITDNAQHLIEFMVVRSGNGYVVEYWADGTLVNRIELSRVAGNLFTDDLVIDAVALYSNHEPGFEALIDTVVVELVENALPASEFITLSSTTHLEGGEGWLVKDLAPFPDADKVVDLSLADDWMLPLNSGGTPGVYTEKANTDAITSLGFDSFGTPSGQGANQFDAWQVVYSFDDGDPVVASDPVILNDPSTGYWGVSWIGNWSGNSANNVFAEWRVDLELGVNQIKHWWNHGVAGSQVLTVSHFRADGSQVEGPASYTIEDGSTPVFVTSVIEIDAEAGDYVIIRQEGTNAGWRATQLVEPVELMVTFDFESTDHLSGGEGWVVKDLDPFPDPDKVIDLTGTLDFMLALNSGDTPGVATQKANADLLSFGGFNSVNADGANQFDTWQVVFSFDGGDPIVSDTGYYGVSWNFSSTGEATMDLDVNFDADAVYEIKHWWNHGTAGSQELNVVHYDQTGARISVPDSYLVPDGSTPVYVSSVITVNAMAGEKISLHHEGANVGWRGTAVRQLGFNEFIGGDNDGNGNYSGTLIGDYSVVADGWIDHAELGLLYVGYASNPYNMIFWSAELDGFIWTAADIYPVVYDFSTASWTRIYVDADLGVYSYDFDTETWVGADL